MAKGMFSVGVPQAFEDLAKALWDLPEGPKRDKAQQMMMFLYQEVKDDQAERAARFEKVSSELSCARSNPYHEMGS